MRSFCPDKIDSRPIWAVSRCGICRDRAAETGNHDLMSHSTKDIPNHLRGIFMVFGERNTQLLTIFRGLIRRGISCQSCGDFFPYQGTILAPKLASKAQRLLAGVNAHCGQR